MRWIVLPPVAPALPGPISLSGSIVNVVTVEVIVPVKVVFVVDVDVAAIPVTIAPVTAPVTAPCDRCPESQSCSGNVTRIIVRVIGITGWRGAIDHRRIVGRDINDFRIGLLDFDDLFPTLGNGLGFHDLLSTGL
jgi:hypothetical protein